MAKCHPLYSLNIIVMLTVNYAAEMIAVQNTNFTAPHKQYEMKVLAYAAKQYSKKLS